MVRKPFRRPEEWHDWFVHQASWTRATRAWLFRQAQLATASAVLEVGCGTGAVTWEVAVMSRARIVGLDIDPEMLAFARQRLPRLSWVRGDACALPFADGSFDIVFCHYLLLWVRDPGRAVAEMARVVRPGGWVIACAEPDYDGRIDHPPELARLGVLQREALRRQGADPEAGRRLGEWFSAAGLAVNVGVMGGNWIFPAHPDDGFAAEWRVRRRDLEGVVPTAELRRLEEVDAEALRSGRRVLFVPTFYALGRKAEEGEA
ncbi:MAG: methyltransferase domain-containing protein [Chloroflexia bacterium]